VTAADRDAPRPLGWLLALVIVLAVVAAFAPALEAELVGYDDPVLLETNPHFRGLGATQLTWMVRTGHMGHFQPLTWLTLSLDYLRGAVGPRGELDPAPFHATNVLLHALAALVVFALARRFATLVGGGTGFPALAGALFAALVFALHPLRAESVAWVTERRDVLSGPLLLLAAWCWLRRGTSAPAEALGGRALLAGLLAAVLALALFFASVSLERPGLLGWGPLGLVGLLGALVAWVLSGLLAARAAPPGSRAWPWMATIFAALSLSAKAWGIVLPALLLVLDAWPLRRARGALPPARAWGRLALEKAQMIEKAMRQVVERDLSVRQTEALVKALKRPPQPKRPVPSANVRDLQERLARSLKTRVRLVPSRKDRGRIEISYSSLDELDRLLTGASAGEGRGEKKRSRRARSRAGR